MAPSDPMDEQQKNRTKVGEIYENKHGVPFVVVAIGPKS